MAFIYILKTTEFTLRDGKELVKIGYTRELFERIESGNAQTFNPFQFDLAYFKILNSESEARSYEQFIFKKFKKNRWKKNKEFFIYNDELKSYILENFTLSDHQNNLDHFGSVYLKYREKIKRRALENKEKVIVTIPKITKNSIDELRILKIIEEITKINNEEWVSISNNFFYENSVNRARLSKGISNLEANGKIERKKINSKYGIQNIYRLKN